MEASNSMNAFALDMFNDLRAATPESNVLISPVSIMTALSMTLLGTAENTEKEMIQSLRIQVSQTQWHKTMGSLLTSLKTGAGNKASPMNVANKNFVDKNYEILKSYSDALMKYYHAEHGAVSFSTDPPGAAQTINEWVKKETKDKIPKLLEPLDPLTRVVLVNAVHFKGFWTEAFKKEHVKKAKFHVNAGKSIDVKMMYQKLKVNFSQNKDALAIEMPFKEDGYSMHFILPTERFGLKKLEDTLLKDKPAFDQLLNSSYPQKVEITIPKFKMRSHLDLVQCLKALGIKDLFDMNTCNLSGVSSGKDLYVSAVVHEACLDVTEDGAEAAAATAVVMMTRAMPMPSPVFYADHPFLVSINYKGAILFLGRVFEPDSS